MKRLLFFAICATAGLLTAFSSSAKAAAPPQIQLCKLCDGIMAVDQHVFQLPSGCTVQMDFVVRSKGNCVQQGLGCLHNQPCKYSFILTCSAACAPNTVAAGFVDCGGFLHATLCGLPIFDFELACNNTCDITSFAYDLVTGDIVAQGNNVTCKQCLPHLPDVEVKDPIE